MKTYLISLSLLILAVIGVRAIFRRSVSQRVIYALWLVVLVRICLPFQIFAVEVPSFFTPDDISQSEVTLAPDTAVKPDTSVIPSVSVQQPSVTSVAPSVTPITPVTPDTQGTPVTPSESASPDTLSPVETQLPIDTPKEKTDIPWTKVLYCAWAAGTMIFLLALGASAIALSRRLEGDREYYMNIGRVKVYVSKQAVSPMLWGLVPAIYLTPDLADDEAYSLVHEQTHLRHGDHIWSVVRALVLSLFWWNPLVWAAVILSKQDAELACDEAISARLSDAERKEYASVIVDNIPKRRTLATGLASAPIKERIIMITRKNKTRIISLLLALVLTIGAVGCSFIGPKDPTPPDTTDPGIQTPPDDEVSGIGPFVGYLESDMSEYIDLYENDGKKKVACIPYEVIANATYIEKKAGKLPLSVRYGKQNDFIWAFVAPDMVNNRYFCLSYDDGATWEFGTIPNLVSGQEASVIFTPDKIGLVVYGAQAHRNIEVLRTDDGGKNWTKLNIEIPFGLSDFTATPTELEYNGKMFTCTVLLENGQGPDTAVEIRTRDGGITWEFEEWFSKIGAYQTVISNTGTRESYLVPAAMYGYSVGDGIAYTSFEKNTNSYWTTLNAGSDVGFWAVFGMQNDYKTQGDFDGYITYRVSAQNGRVVALDMVETYTKERVLDAGTPYYGELKGTYKAKAFSRGDGLTSYTFTFNNGTLTLSAYRAGSGAGGTYNGTYTYDKSNGAFEASVKFSSTNNGTTTTSDTQKISGRFYEYDGFIHLIVDKSEAAMIESADPLPISFKKDDRPGDFDMMSKILIGGALTEKQLAGEAVSDEVVRSFIAYTCVSYYRENGFIYSGYWKLTDNNMTWYMSAEDAARIAYEVFGVENYNGGEIKIPNGIGLGSGSGWSAADTVLEQNGDTVILHSTLVGNDVDYSADKVFGTYSYTFKYITEGERSFWRYVGCEEKMMPYYARVSAYDCRAGYFDANALTYGSYTIFLPIDTKLYDVDFDVRRCNDGCGELSEMVSIITQGYAPVYTPMLTESHASSEEYPYRTHSFKWKIPEMMIEGLEKQGVLDQIKANLERRYMYLLELGDGYYAYIGIEVKETNTDANAADVIIDAVKKAQINPETLSGVTYYRISENYAAHIPSDHKTLIVQKNGESDSLTISCTAGKGEGVYHVSFLPGSTNLIASEDEKTLVVTYTSDIDTNREGATLFDLEAKQVRNHYLPRPEEIIAVNDPTGELAKKFHPYYESGQWQITCTAEADGAYIVLTYELSCPDMMFRASERVSRDSYYGGLKSDIAVSYMKALEFLDRFELAKELSSWFYHTSNLYEYDAREQPTIWHGYSYLPATNPLLAENNVTDIPTLKAYFETVFTKEIVDYFMVMCTDEENVSKCIAIPYIAHFDGQLWGFVSVAGNRYGMPELCTIEESSERVTLVYRHYDTAAPDIASSVREYNVSFVKVDGKWLCENYLIF